jgi:glutathione S-transferase
MVTKPLPLEKRILQIKPNPVSEHCRPGLCGNLGSMLRLVLAILIAAATLAAKGPVYVVLWFDTEDYIEPAADDAALRIATDLENLGVRATFKVVGEKARVLEARGRRDVIRALSRHDIGYHSNFHSMQPTPALYLRDMGWFDGAAEFERRERPGLPDLQRIFGITPSCYGQPGSSWAPQAYRALLRMGIPVYLDEGEHVGVESQPYWFAGMLSVFHMGRYQIRPSLEDESALAQTFEKFDSAAAELEARGGGVISTYFHPTEFVTSAFWDLNFAKGANPERSDWKNPPRRTADESERCYRILTRYVEHAKARAGLRFVTARQLPLLYESDLPRVSDRAKIAQHMAERQTFLVTDEAVLSAADMLQVLLGMDVAVVEGPAVRSETTDHDKEIPRAAFEHAKNQARGIIRTNRRLPAEVWIGSKTLSLADFAATLAADDGVSATVALRKGNPEMEKYIATDATGVFRWPIHPEGFSAPQLLEMARLQAWTLKPARLK